MIINVLSRDAGMPDIGGTGAGARRAPVLFAIRGAAHYIQNRNVLCFQSQTALSPPSYCELGRQNEPIGEEVRNHDKRKPECPLFSAAKTSQLCLLLRIRRASQPKFEVQSSEFR